MNNMTPQQQLEFVNKVRVMLIRLAQTEHDDNGLRNAVIDPERQWLEGFLGIHRKELATENPSVVDDVLAACGIIEKKPQPLRVVNPPETISVLVRK